MWLCCTAPRRAARASEWASADCDNENQDTPDLICLHDSDYICVAYTSKLTCAPEDVSNVVGSIVTHSAAANAKQAIGGVLNVSGTKVVQVLEGPPAAVHALFATIATDTRHTAVEKVYEERRSYRTYEQFGMLLSTAEGLEHGCCHEERETRLPSPLQEFRARIAVERPQAFVEGNVARAPLLRLAYRSRLVAADRASAEAMLESVLQQSFRNNPRHAIGGILFVQPEGFHVAQVLEGAPAAVIRLAAIICDDARHCDFRIVRQVYTTVRQYPQFGMVNGGAFNPNRPEDEDPFTWARTPNVNSVGGCSSLSAGRCCGKAQPAPSTVTAATGSDAGASRGSPSSSCEAAV